MGAGLAQIARGAPKIPLDLLNQALVAGLDLEYKAEAFESLVVDTADACRAGGTWKMVDTPFAQATVPMAWTGDTWRLATAHETADATLMTGPSNLGGFLRLTLEPARTPAGPSVGERAVAFWAFCDRELGTRIGPLEAAPDVRA
jgi:hypothetical protein